MKSRSSGFCEAAHLVPRPRGLRALIAFATALTPLLPLVAQEVDPRHTALPPDKEAAVHLQVFLDRAEFSPGKIDGRYGDFTRRALELYRKANGLAAPPSADVLTKPNGENSDPKPSVADLDLSSAAPIFIDYTVREADLKNVGLLPAAVEAQAKLPSLPYQSAGEAIAEKFHTDQKFLEELNPGKIGSLKAGDSVRVPNVEPFELAAVKDLSQKKSDQPAADSAENAAPNGKSSTSALSLKVDTKTNMLSVYDNEHLVGAYPVTIGSNRTESPLGEWKITGVAKMPDYRHDKAMLERGERSSEFAILPPGPNNPVGVIWIQLNKKGIGLHGTSAPDTIGRSESHGCIRLANWDVIRLAAKVTAGVAVEIR